MHEILKDRVWRKLEALPQDQVYQVLDYIEFLEARYAKEKAARPDALQRFAERVEDSLRMRSVAPSVISGTVGLLGTAHKVMRTVSDAGRGILGDAPAPGSRPPRTPARATQVTTPPAAGRSDGAADSGPSGGPVAPDTSGDTTSPLAPTDVTDVTATDRNESS